MFIAANAMSPNLPSDVSALGNRPVLIKGMIDLGQIQGGSVSPDLEEPGPSLGALVLDRWDVQSHQYKTKAEVEMSILARLVSSKVDASSYGIVQETKRFCIKRTDKGRNVQYGVAVRLSVAVLSTEFDISLTLPNIAAKAQIGDTRARIALSVDGYTGPLGELLPAPDNLNVENFALYIGAFKSIQAQVFGAAGMNYMAPTLLGFEEAEKTAP